jgi:hypothetical protein
LNRILFEGTTLVNSVEEDHLRDEVGIFCKKLREKNSWTADAHEIKNNLLSALKKQKYSFFTADPHRYGLSQIGESCLVNVPLKQRGHLKKFRGCQIRLLCIGTGRYKREYAAKKINFGVG